MPSLLVPPLRSGALWLRPHERGDLDHLAGLVTRPEVMARMGGALLRDEVAGLLDRYLTPDDPRIFCALAALEAETGAYVGSALLTRSRVLEDTPELGFLVGPDHEGRGHATAMARALIEVARTRAHAARVCATVDEDHSASIRVLEKAGLTCIGVCPGAPHRRLYCT